MISRHIKRAPGFLVIARFIRAIHFSPDHPDKPGDDLEGAGQTMTIKGGSRAMTVADDYLNRIRSPLMPQTNSLIQSRPKRKSSVSPARSF